MIPSLVDVLRRRAEEARKLAEEHNDSQSLFWEGMATAFEESAALLEFEGIIA